MKTLIWDFDGTLGYRTGRWSGAILETIEQTYPELAIDMDAIRATLQGGFPWHQPDIPHTNIRTPEQWWAMLNPVLEMSLATLGVDKANIPWLIKRIRANYVSPTTWALFDDVLPGFSQLTEMGWQHFILSNHVPELMTIVEGLGLAPHIRRVFNSAELGYEKPHPMAFQMVLETLDTTDEVWMIGDNMDADINGATKIGLQAILLRKEHPQAATRCADILEVVELLSK